MGRVFGRFALLAAITGLAQWVLFRESVQPETASLLQAAQRDAEVFFIGDSSTFEHSSTGGHGASIGDLLDSDLPGCNVASVVGAGYRPDLYEALFETLASLTDATRLVIVPTNIRVFGPNWMHNPMYDFEHFHQMLALERAGLAAFIEPLRILGAIAPEFHVDVMSHPAIRKELARIDARTAEDDLDSGQRHQILHYDFSIGEENPMLEAMASLRRSVKARGARFLTYIAPTSFAYVRSKSGPEAEQAARKNLEQVLRAYAANEIEVLDLSNLAMPGEFVFYGGMADHLSTRGHARVASELATATEGLLPACVTQRDVP